MCSDTSNNIIIKAFENSLVELINSVPLPIAVKELVVDRVHRNVIDALNTELKREAEDITKGETDGKEVQ